ncbi:MAG: hypothetical protein Q4C72_02875 [Eubacteriales bacterium]|nr:hypothetical protein [Eubacteriales bacterium]
MDENRQERPIRTRPGVRAGNARARRRAPNYRLLLCAALAVCALLAILFFALFLGRGGKIKELNEQVKTLTEQTQALTNEKTQLQQTMDGLYTAAIAALPDPTTAQTQSLPDLIPQLTEGVYVVRSTGESYQYLSVPSGILQDKLAAFRDDAANFKPAEGDAPTCNYWVLFSDRVIGLAEGDTGFVSTSRTATGSATSVPAGFTAFVASLFA